jgi:hypothetical protein
MSLLDHYAAIARARARIADAIDEARAVVAALGLEPREVAIDAPRLRAVRHEGHAIAAAAPVYYAHRDTWYANPRAQLNVWIPLHDVSAEEGFDVYPDALAVPVANDSRGFDFDAFARDVGWQRPDPPPGAAYPRATEAIDRFPALPIAAPEGEIVVFSAAHLHRTRAHAAGRTRFSVDFRVVHLGDYEAGAGAPDVDDESTGSALATYRRLG